MEVTFCNKWDCGYCWSSIFLWFLFLKYLTCTNILPKFFYNDKSFLWPFVITSNTFNTEAFYTYFKVFSWSSIREWIIRVFIFLLQIVHIGAFQVMSSLQYSNLNLHLLQHACSQKTMQVWYLEASEIWSKSHAVGLHFRISNLQWPSFLFLFVYCFQLGLEEDCCLL